MTVLQPELLYSAGRFHAGLALEFSERSGLIERIVPAADASEPALGLPGHALMPGFVNAHSHAFQRLIRGRAQWRRPGDPSDFWTWREAMYEAVASLDPDDIYAVSRFCFLEMLRAGYTTVGEFHYVHRDPSGARYDDPNELAKRVVAAAEDAGIRIRLLHVAYATGGIGEPLQPEQRRFATPVLEEYLADVAALESWAGGRDLASVGVAPHSVRAVPVEWIEPIHDFARDHDLPFHMHASEQPAEVAAAEAVHGRRPIELIADRGALDDRTTLVHATHASAHEIALLARSTVCGCPTTERDLGDGFLPGAELLRAGARIAIGTDSQTVIAPLEELRLIEYNERLRRLRRVVLAEAIASESTGDDAGRLEVAPALLRMATANGAHSLRLPVGALEPGCLADFVSVDLGHPALAGWTRDSLDAMLALAAPPDVIADVWVGGVQRVERGRHAPASDAAAAFREVARKFT